MQPPILQSNAAESHPDIPLRALQEYSNNRQTATPASFYDPDVEHYTTPPASESVWTGPQSIIRPLCVPQLPWFPNYNTRPVPAALAYTGPLTYSEEEYEIQKAKSLHARWMEFEKYARYRENSGKGGKKGQDPKWPDHVEMAFMRALVRHHPRGRSQIRYKDKAQGRNESIAATIQELVGGDMGRKQVSSHNQVLKKWFEKDRYIMSFFDESEPLARQKNKLSAQKAVESRMRAALTATLGRAGTSQSSLDVFQPTKFTMHIQQKYLELETGEERIKVLHTYSQHQNRQPLADHQATTRDWRSAYPQLAYILGDVAPACNMLIGNASIRLPPVKYNGTGIELGVSLTCSTSCVDDVIMSKSRLRFIGFEDVIQEINPGANGPFVQEDPIVWEQSEEAGRGHDTHLRFGSVHWARCLSKLAALLPAQAALADQYLRRLSILQEVFTKCENEDTGDPEWHRLLIIYWQFCLAEDRSGSTVWHRIGPSDDRSVSRTSAVTSSSRHIKKSLRDVDLDAILEHSYSAGGYQYEQDMGVIPRLPFLQSPFEHECNSAASSASRTAWPLSPSHVNSAVALGSFGDAVPAAQGSFESDDATIDLANFDFTEFDANFDIRIQGGFGEDYSSAAYIEPSAGENGTDVRSYSPNHNTNDTNEPQPRVQYSYEGQVHRDKQDQMHHEQTQYDDVAATDGASLHPAQHLYHAVSHGMMLPTYSPAQSRYMMSATATARTPTSLHSSRPASPHTACEVQAHCGAGLQSYATYHEHQAKEGASALAVLAGVTACVDGLARVEELPDVSS